MEYNVQRSDSVLSMGPWEFIPKEGQYIPSLQRTPEGGFLSRSLTPSHWEELSNVRLLITISSSDPSGHCLAEDSPCTENRVCFL